MKSRKKQVMCLTLVFILFFLGMCSQTERVHSLLTTLHSIEEADTIDRAGMDCSYIGKGTAALISGLRNTFQTVRREQIRTNLRWHAEFLRMEEMTGISLVFSAVAAVILYRIQGNEATILNYIHKQDGEK